MKPETKNAKKVFNVLQTRFAYLSPKSNAAQPGTKTGNEDFVGEFQTVLDQDFFDFILYEVPWIIF